MTGTSPEPRERGLALHRPGLWIYRVPWIRRYGGDGRKTCDEVLTFGPYPYSGKTSYVVSRSRAGTRDENVVFVGSDIVGVVRRLREEAGRNIWIVVGSELVDLFMRERLIDEFIVSIHPVVLGSGITLFRLQAFETWLTLMKCEQFPGGLVQLHYETRK